MQTMTIRLGTTLSTTALLAIVTFCGAQIGCATTQPMRSGNSVPASEGTVKIDNDSNGNLTLELRVKHLAPPSRVAADSTVYVAWIQPRNGEKQSVGVLKLDSGLEGVLETTTMHRSFVLTVTPEPSATGSKPTHDAVFTTSVERPQ